MAENPGFAVQFKNRGITSSFINFLHNDFEVNMKDFAYSYGLVFLCVCVCVCPYVTFIHTVHTLAKIKNAKDLLL